jgi:GT2 family glycosyltransferase
MRADSPTIAVAICTKGRRPECAACVASVLAQTRPASQLIIVEAATDDGLRDRIEAAWPPGLDTALTCARVAEGGLTRQRNIAVGRLTSDIVLFVDDDAVLEPECLEGLAGPYRDDAEHRLGGVQAAIIDSVSPPTGSKLFRRLFFLTEEDSGRRAVLRASGWPRYCSTPARPMDAEVIRGTAMSFRREVFEAERFDESFPGYALAEDCDFSYRVSRRWRLLVEPAARVRHSPSPAGRSGARTFQRMEAVHSWHLFRHYRRGTAAWIAFAWSRLGGGLLALRHAIQIGSLDPLRGLADGYRAILRGRR